MEGSLPEKTCRTCLQESDELTSLYAKEDDTGPTLLEKLRFCTSMEVLVLERTPLNACAECVRCIVEYYNFKQRCEFSEKTLEHLYGLPSEYTVPKVEVEEEDGDSTIVIKKEPDDSNLSCDDDSKWTPCLDEKEDSYLIAKETERGSGDDDGQSESELNSCPLCGERFKSAEERPTRVLFCRVYDGTGENQLRCKMCKKTFDFRADLSQHILSHITEHPFECDTCGELLDTKSQMQTHECDCPEEESPSNDTSSGLTADVLEESANSNLGQHDSKDEKLSPDPKKEHPCDVCSRSFATFQLLKRHKKRCNTALEHPYRLRRHMEMHQRRTKYNCEMCGKSYLKERTLRIHIEENHAAEKPVYVCDLCGKTYNFLASLCRHRRSHNAPEMPRSKFICEKCGKGFTKQRVLRVHIEENHAAEKPLYVCDVCGKTYNFQGSLNSHKVTHKAPEIKCDYCERTFPNKARLGQHTRTTHKKSHACDECDKRFPSNSRLLKHKAHHIRETGKPYSCEICNKRFSTMPAVAFHVDMQHRGGKKHLKCDVCGMEFYNRFHLAAHYSGHTGVKPCRCDGCGMGFNYIANLTHHKKKCASVLELAKQ